MTPRAPLDELLSGLTDAQAAAVKSEAQPLCVVASAGSGKTRVLTRRIAYRAAVGSASASHTLALTFTRKAAGELQSRLRALGLREHVTAGTFHAIASAQLQRWWADRRKHPPVLLERKARLIGQLSASRPGLSGVSVSELAGHIEWAKARLVRPDEFEAAARDARRPMPAGARAADIAALYDRYEHEKTRRGLVDFDDLLSHCAAAIETDPAFCGAQRWKWRHVFVDEFQDLNPLQHRLLLAWLGSSTDLCVVGDPNQAIYGWNGADPRLLDGFSRRWPDGEVLFLDHNHRCTPQVVAAAARVLGPAGDRLRSAADAGPQPLVRSFASDTAEARGIAAAVVRAHELGRRWGSIAVLARTNAQLVVIGDALAASGVPYWAPGRKSLLSEPVTLEVTRWASSDAGRPLQGLAADLEEAAGRGAAAPGSLFDRPLDDQELSAISALAALARTFHRQDPAATVGQWLRWLPAALRDEVGTDNSNNSVTLCSFHRAKGLEWESVWIAGLEAGLVPISRATGTGATESSGRAGRAGHDALAEERRLLYVALTRAARELHCSWSRTRTFGSRSVPRDPSPWLDAISPGSAGSPSRHGEGVEVTPDEWRRRIRKQRERLGRTDARGAPTAGDATDPPGRSPRRGQRAALRLVTPDDNVVNALRAWRTETARASGVPAYVVMHDTTLKALASLRPSSVDELLAVPGLGPVKAGRYGTVLLALLAERAETA